MAFLMGFLIRPWSPRRSPSPLRHYATTPLRHYATTPLRHYETTRLSAQTFPDETSPPVGQLHGVVPQIARELTPNPSPGSAIRVSIPLVLQHRSVLTFHHLRCSRARSIRNKTTAIALSRVFRGERRGFGSLLTRRTPLSVQRDCRNAALLQLFRTSAALL